MERFLVKATPYSKFPTQNYVISLWIESSISKFSVYVYWICNIAPPPPGNQVTVFNRLGNVKMHVWTTCKYDTETRFLVGSRQLFLQVSYGGESLWLLPVLCHAGHHMY